MNILKNLYLFNKKTKNSESFNYEVSDQYKQIAKLVNGARKQQNLSIKELSDITKIPEQTIISIENNNEIIRPKYPFIRSILIKLEVCLGFEKNRLVGLVNKEKEVLKKEKKDFLVRKFDIINSWQGTLLYFLLLVLTIFLLKRFFILNVNLIEIQNIENKIIEK